MRTAFRLLLVLLIGFAFVRSTEAQGYKRLRLMSEVSQAWEEGIQVYAKGETAYDPLLEDLAVKAKAVPNFTFLILSDYRGESCVVEGEELSGARAIDAIMEVLLGNRPEFTEKVDPGTGLSSRAIIAICFSPRDLKFKSSPHMERFGLSNQATWDRGPNYSGVALGHLNPGRRYVPALIDTAKAIEAGVVQKVAQEKERAAKELREATGAVKAAVSSWGFLESRLLSFIDTYPDLDGDISRSPDLEKLIGTRENAEASLAKGDLEGALSAAAFLKDACERHLKLLSEYPGAEKTISELRAKLAELKTHEFASSASFEPAIASIDAAQSEWKRGDSSYLASLEAAGLGVARVESDIDGAAFLSGLFHTSFWIVVCIIIAAMAFAARYRWVTAAAAREKALKLIAEWRRVLGEKGEMLGKLDDEKRTVLGDRRTDVAFTGATGQLAEVAIHAVGNCRIMLSCALRVLEEAEALASTKDPRSFFDAEGFERAERMLGEESILFHPNSDIALVMGDGKQAECTDYDVLWEPLSKFRPFCLCFEELMEAFGDNAKVAVESLEKVENASLTATSKIKAVQAVVDEAEAKNAELRKLVPEGHELALSVFTATLVPKFEQRLAGALRQSLLDPVDALKTAESVEKRVAIASTTVCQMSDGMKDKYPGIDQGRELLVAQRISPTWIAAGVQRIFANANAVLDALAAHGVPPSIRTIEEQFADLMFQVNAALSLDERRRGKAGADIEAGLCRVSEMRRQLSETLEAEPAQILCETDDDGQSLDPGTLLGEAREFLAAARLHIGTGELQDAEKDLNNARAKYDAAVAIMDKTAKIFESFGAVDKAIVAEGEELTQRHDEAASVLQGICANFSASVLELGAGDASHPRANGTVEDNLDEVDRAASERDEHLETARAKFQAGCLLEAAALLDQADAANDHIRFRQNEIHDKNRRLAAAVSANGRALDTLGAELESLEAQVEDPRCTSPWLDSLKGAKRSLKQAKKERDAQRPDPFWTAKVLDGVRKGLEALRGELQRDFSVHAEARRSIDAASRELGQLRSDLGRVIGNADGIADSPEMTGVSRLASRLSSACVALDQEFGEANHPQTWSEFDRRADRMFDEATSARAELKGEVREGRQAVNAVNDAAGEVRSAGRRNFSYGVYIPGNPGANAIQNAKTALSRGDYSAAKSYARRAEEDVQRAVSAALAEVAERKAAELRRIRLEKQQRAAAEARRLQRMARQSRNYSSPSTNVFGNYSTGVSTNNFGGYTSGVSTVSW